MQKLRYSDTRYEEPMAQFLTLGKIDDEQRQLQQEQNRRLEKLIKQLRESEQEIASLKQHLNAEQQEIAQHNPMPCSLQHQCRHCVILLH